MAARAGKRDRRAARTSEQRAADRQVSSPDLAVIRFHSRRAKTLEAKGIPVVERFRYLYSREALAEGLPKIHTVAERSREVHVPMNNCYANYGATNARELAATLKPEESSNRCNPNATE